MQVVLILFAMSYNHTNSIYRQRREPDKTKDKKQGIDDRNKISS